MKVLCGPSSPPPYPGPFGSAESQHARSIKSYDKLFFFYYSVQLPRRHHLNAFCGPRTNGTHSRHMLTRCTSDVRRASLATMINRTCNLSDTSSNGSRNRKRSSSRHPETSTILICDNVTPSLHPISLYPNFDHPIASA